MIRLAPQAIPDVVPSPTVSVVVPTFNRSALLKETLDAIFAQTFTDFELIIVDNMSEDGTEEYVTGITDSRVRYFKNPNNGVIAVSRNFGIRKARGPFVAFCDDDDLWLPDKLERQLCHMADNGISCVATDCIPIGDVKYFSKLLSIPGDKTFRDFSYQDILFLLNPVISSSVLARKTALVDEGGFDESADYCFIEDWELWLRMSRRGTIRILAEPLLKYRMYDKEGRDARQVTLNTLKIIDKHADLGFMDSVTAQTARANCSVLIGRAFLECGDRRGMRYYIRGLLGSSCLSLRIRAALGGGLLLLPSWIRCTLLRLAYSTK